MNIEHKASADPDAFNEGQVHGHDLGSFVGDCPYGHDQNDLRMSWVDGFSAGRISQAAETGAQTAGERSRWRSV